MARSSKRRGRLLLVSVSILLTIAASEVGLRILGVSYPVVDRLDEFTGWGYAPGRTWSYDQEGSASVSINSYGYRDAEWTLAKPRDAFRIAVLGDSYVDALQVDKADRFTDRLETLLEGRGPWHGKSVEVMNFGVGGFGTGQQLQTLRYRVLQFEPDAVLLAVCTGNDIRDNSRELDQEKMRPYFTREGDALQLDSSFLDSDDYRGSWLKTIMRAAARVSVNAQLAVRLRRLQQSRSRAANDEQGYEPGLDDAIYAEPRTQAWEEAWLVTERLVREVRDESLRAGARFYAVTLSNEIQVHPDPEERAEFMREAGADDLFYPERRLAAVAAQHGFPLLQLAPALQRLAEEQGVFLHGFANVRMGTGHWNVDGHREAAGLIAEWLEAHH